MSQAHSIVLTNKDHATLKGMLHCDGAHNSPRAAALQRKLEGAVVVMPENIAPDIVTLGSRVRLRIDDGPAEERTVVASNADEITGLTLLAWTSRGLALLGMKAGQRSRCLRLDGALETITVEEVAFQPEAYQRESAMRTPSILHPSPAFPAGGNVTRLSSYRRRTYGDLILGPDGEGWGPDAA